MREHIALSNHLTVRCFHGGRAKWRTGGVTVLCLLGGCLLEAGASAAARPAAVAQEANTIISRIDAGDLETLMEAEGYAVTVDEDDVVIWKLNGFRTHVFVASDGGAIQFHSSFGDGNATLKKTNEWNRTKRFSRTYLDEEGDPHLELDLDLDGGVTRARVLDFLKTCRLSFDSWCEQVVE